ncbi:tripartite motif-containing protein 2-like [Dysidea avara]|uniref:tripartite motif-containing protein 2-like n=1 Tax=Dysidea avara TaxID=196820 RepID=UPI00332F52D4
MMSAVEVKKAQNNLTCPICNQLFSNPKYLPCYHSYGEGCLEKMQVQSKIICPECRKEAKVPAGGVKEFATNFFINRLVDDLILKKKVAGEEKVNCDECDEDDPVVSFCPDCNSFLCSACNDSHNRQKKYRGHGVVPLTELRSNKDTPAIQAKVKIPLCKEHDYELKHYCETCDELVCMYCTMKDHNGHDHDTVNKMASKHRSQLKKVTIPIEEMIQDLSGVHCNIDKMKKKIRKQGDEVNKQIDQHYVELVEKLMKQKDQVKQQVCNTVSQKEKALTTQLDEVDSTQAELVSMKELNDALEKSSDQEALSTMKQVIDGMQQLTKKYKKLNKHPVQCATMGFIAVKNDFPQFGSFFANVDLCASEVVNLPQSIVVGKKVEVTIITKDSIGDHFSTGGHKVFVQLKSFAGNVTVGEVRDNNDGSYVALFVGEQVGEIKLHVSINGQKIRGSPYNIAVVRNYQALNLPNKIANSNGRMGKPFGVALGRNGVWAVSDCLIHCVYVFDGQDKLTVKFGSHGKNNGQLNYPEGIAFDNDNHLYVVDSGNHRVQKFDVNGNYLLQFGDSGSHDRKLQDPYGITTHNGKAYIADNGNHRISVFRYNGQFCISFGSDQLGGPYDVAVNVNNQLLVADHSNHCIVTFTLDGHYVGKFGTQGSNRGQLNQPYSLATDMNGFILVGDRNHHVSVFDQVGNFIHCFGSKGTANGQFYYPFGLALSPNGSIYVSDCENKRIQIFTSY